MCDIVESTKLSVLLSSSQMAELLSNYYFDCISSMEANFGRAIRCIGDGVLGIFDDSDNNDLCVLNAAKAARLMREKILNHSNPDFYDRHKISVRISIVSGHGITSRIKPLAQEVVFGRLPFLANQLLKSANLNEIMLNAKAAECIKHQTKPVKSNRLSFFKYPSKVVGWKLVDARKLNGNSSRLTNPGENLLPDIQPDFGK